MKKFLPTKGFTLVELLVVIAIIAILATIGFTVFSGTGAKARDAKRKADIDAIAKAYEVNYNQATAQYVPLEASQFTSGVQPSPPTTQEGSYTGLLTGNAATFTVCATLEGGTASCTATSATCYCRSAAQAGTTATAGPVACAIFNNSTSQTCYADNGTGIAIVNPFIRCADIPGTINLNCAASNCSPLIPNITYYTSANSTTPAGTNLRLGPRVCSPNNQTTVTIR